MNPRAEVRALNSALSQLDRVRAAPAPDRVKVDGRSVAELLSFAAEYGTLIKFYDLSDNPEGDWSAFFAGDRSILLALCAGLDLREIENSIAQRLRAMRDEDAVASRLDILTTITRVIGRLVGILERCIDQPITLMEALATLSASRHRDVLAVHVHRLHTHLGDRTPHQSFRHPHRDDWIALFITYLENVVSGLISALVREQRAALSQLEASMQDQTHAPQAAMWNTFVLLFGHAQSALNRFPRRLIDFYQNAVLHQNATAGQADQLVLAFTLDKGAENVTVPAGTLFPASDTDAGESVAFALDNALQVDGTSISGMRTLTRTSAPVITGGVALPAQLLSNVVPLASTVPAITSPFPAFGSDVADSAATRGTQPVGSTSTKASLGFAVSSPYLLLDSGTRRITVGLDIDADALAAISSVLTDIGGSSATPNSTLAALLAGAFSLRYSSSQGWVDIPPYTVTPPGNDETTFLISVLLDADAAGWQAPSPVSKGQAANSTASDVQQEATVDSDQPTLIASLRQEKVTVNGNAVYPYSVLATLALAALTIDVAVDGMRDIHVSSMGAPIDTRQPFALFGAVPVQYAAFNVSANEWFVKRLSSLSLCIDWYGLPVSSTGFQGYYQNYVINANGQTVAPGSLFDNASFIAGLEVVNPGLWTIDAATQTLFQTTSNDSTVAPAAPVLPQTTWSPALSASQCPPYYDCATSAIRVSLEQPNYAFGNVLYAQNVMAASVQLSAAAAACAQQYGRASWVESAIAKLAPIVSANTTASDAEHSDKVKRAIQQAVAGLDGDALAAIQQSIAADVGDPATQTTLRTSLSAALGTTSGSNGRSRLSHFGARLSSFVSVHTQLQQWLEAHASALHDTIEGYVTQARALLDAGSGVLALQSTVDGKAPALARPLTTAGVQGVQTSLTTAGAQASQNSLQNCMAKANAVGLPNTPWLPMASRISVTYTAGTALPTDVALPSESADSAATFGDTRFYHLSPFNNAVAVHWGLHDTVPLLAPIAADGMLYIDIAESSNALSMVFQLVPPASGWPTGTPPVRWDMATPDGNGDSAWRALTLTRDTTNGLRHPGLVDFALDKNAAGIGSAIPLCIRASVAGDTDAFPYIAGLATNAAMATRQSARSAGDTGWPIPAGTITRAATAIDGIARIDQPLPSSGGQSAYSGARFDMWLAERLAHKDRGIQEWDYASLVLAAFTTQWQVAVVPASNGGIGAAPGHVWIVAVPGPNAGDIADRTIPSNDAETLKQIAAYLSVRISPFIQLTVTNPPYRRITVHAELIFDTRIDDAGALTARLNQDLIDYLSPWPTATAGVRRADYYTRKEVAHFIRQRPYVRGILSLLLSTDGPPLGTRNDYFTSALSHSLQSKAAAVNAAAPSLSFALPDGTSQSGDPM
jgi:hypothetical protein